ncbi:4-hydroxy-tetrahydrodipicolinate reductase [Christensenellaceae bacterium OttesenSCG-928-L17]|nr:4-hydroxy-tetrahydrodipicolinate reductase [Christensenellaceae bacterium OttesenSCG-928-L17]
MKIALCGLGRAGTQVLRRVIAQEGDAVCMAFCRNGSKKAGQDISDFIPVKDLSIPIYEVRQAAEVFAREKPDVLIDFSSRQATLQLLPACKEHGVNMVVCTTNFKEAELNAMRLAGEQTPGFAIAYAPNITLGVNVLMHLCEETAKMLPEFDYAITEKHHNRKMDVSATAKKIADVLESTLHREVQVNSIRAGGYVGLHEVLAVGEFERITIIHESFSRQSFALGALIAAEFLMDKQGYFEMRDIVAHHLSTAKAPA